MDLRDYLRVLRKGWPLILAFVILGLAAGIGLTLSTTKVYESSSQISVVVPPGSGGSDSLAQGSTYGQNLVQSAITFATSPLLTERVAKEVNANKKTDLTSNGLAAKISADAPLNKTLINLHVTDHDPALAAYLVNRVTARYITVLTAAEPKDSTGRPVVTLTVAHPGQIPGSPIKPNKLLNIGLGFVVGLLIGVGVVVLRDVLDNTIKDGSDFAEAGVPTMGVVPFDKRTVTTPIAFRADPNSARSEAYRQIRTNLQFVNVDNPPRIISVTSALPGEGKSTTSLNLAAALAEAGSRVCLIEADLRRPSLAKALGLVGDVGFTTALIGKTPVQDVLQNAGQNLAVLTSGPIPPNPSELLITDHARQIIQEVASHVDFVIIDTPPLLPVTDGATVATLADATLLVARAGKTTRDQGTRSLEALEKVGRTPVGVVLSMVTRGRGGYSYEYGYYYTANERPDKMNTASVGIAGGQSAPDSPISLDDPMDSAHSAHPAELPGPADHGQFQPAHDEQDGSLDIMSASSPDSDATGEIPAQHAAEPDDTATDDMATGPNGDATRTYPTDWQRPGDEPGGWPFANGDSPNGESIDGDPASQSFGQSRGPATKSNSPTLSPAGVPVPARRSLNRRIG